MARNDEEKILVLERQAARLGYEVMEQSVKAGERELAQQFHLIADHHAQKIKKETPAERRRLRQGMSTRIKILGDVIREKHIQYQLLPFRCIDEHDECVRKQKRQKKSPYLCFLALVMLFARQMNSARTDKYGDFFCLFCLGPHLAYAAIPRHDSQWYGVGVVARHAQR